MTARITISTPDGGRVILLDRAEDRACLSDALRRHGVPLNTRCAGRGLCDGCRVRVDGGVVRPAVGDGEPQATAIDGTVQACQVRAGGAELRLTVPTRSLVHDTPQVIDAFELGVPLGRDPLPAGDGEPEATGLAAAVDLGTTTVAVLLIDRAGGQVVGRASGFNRQVHLGDDVLTRINLCLQDHANLSLLQRVVWRDTVLPLIDRAAAVAGAAVSSVALVAVAGNTTMLHLLAGMDPTPMGVAPFTPPFTAHRRLTAGALAEATETTDARLSEGAVVHLLPSAAAYLGADVVGGVVVSGLAYEDGPALLVDVGTNGEIVLKHGGRMLACATAAGPAFEGRWLSCGTRACDGAIDHIAVQPDGGGLTYHTIGGGRPLGICGSAYIDLLADGPAAGLINRQGRLTAAAFDPATDGEPTPRSLHVAWGADRAPIRVTDADLATLIQAKAATAAGIRTLLDECGLTPGDVRRVYFAGGFAAHVDPSKAIAAGLLPGFQPGQVRPVGNTSLAAAYAAVVDQRILHEMTDAATRMRVLELNEHPRFEDNYIDEMLQTHAAPK